MTTGAVPNPNAPMAAVEEVWRDHQEVVDRFRLVAEPGGVFENSWFVLVRCDHPNPDTYELVEVLRRLERLVEQKSGLDVTLMLSNLPSSRNGTYE